MQVIKIKEKLTDWKIMLFPNIIEITLYIDKYKNPKASIWHILRWYGFGKLIASSWRESDYDGHTLSLSFSSPFFYNCTYGYNILIFTYIVPHYFQSSPRYYCILY